MRTKNGKRIGPVPIALVAVLALAAFISAGLLLAVNSGQTVAAQSSVDCTVGATMGQDVVIDSACRVPGTEATIKFEGALPTTGGTAPEVTNFFVYGTNVGAGSERSKVYPQYTMYMFDDNDPEPSMVECTLRDAMGVDVVDDNGDTTKMVRNKTYVDTECEEVDPFRSQVIEVGVPGNSAKSQILTITGDELSDTDIYVFRGRPTTSAGFVAINNSAEEADYIIVPGTDDPLNLLVKFLGPPSAAKKCDNPLAACSTLMANRGDPVRSDNMTTELVLTVRDENGDMLEGFAQLSLVDAGSALFAETNRDTQTVMVDSVTGATATVKGLPSTGAFKYTAMADFETNNGTLIVKTTIQRLGDAETIDAAAYLCVPGGKDEAAVEDDVDTTEVVETADARPCLLELKALNNTDGGDDPDPFISVAPGATITIHGSATDSAGNKVSSLEWSATNDAAKDAFNPDSGNAETEITVGTGSDAPGTYEIKVNDTRDDAEIMLTIVVADKTSQVSLEGPEMIAASTGLATFTVTATDSAGNVPSDVADLNEKYTVAVRNKDAKVLGVDGSGFVIFNKFGVGTFQVLMPEDAVEGISLSITVGYKNITDTVVVMYGEMMVEPEPMMPMLLGAPSITSVMSDAAGMATVMLTPGDNASKHWVWAAPTDGSTGMWHGDSALAGDADMVTFSALTSGMNYWFIAVAGRGEGDASEWSAWSSWTAETPIQ